MKPENPGGPVRLALIATLAVAPVAAPVHARAAEAGPAIVPARIELGADVWRLRPTVSGAQASAPAPSPRDLRNRPATAIPDERRNVRMVYPALTEAR